MVDLPQASVGNRLLAALSPRDFERLRPHLHRVALNVQDTLVVVNEAVPFAHFVESGVASLVAADDAGIELEIAVIGREGMTGVALLHGMSRSSHSTFVQMAGSAQRISAEALHGAMEDSPSLRAALLAFAHEVFTQVSRSALTHGRYKIPQRLARWLLLCHDRLDHDDLPLTHGFLSLMLGVHRPGVTKALHELEGMRGIKASRGLIRVLDRGILEEIAGGCYGNPERGQAPYARSG